MSNATFENRILLNRREAMLLAATAGMGAALACPAPAIGQH